MLGTGGARLRRLIGHGSEFEALGVFPLAPE